MYKLLTVVFSVLFIASAFLQAEETRLLRFPNSSKTDIAFTHAGDIYVVPINGGVARKVTTAKGDEMFPRFSADGKTIAFSAEYDGNREIYTMPFQGGEAKRLTFSMDHSGLSERMGPDKIIMQWLENDSKILYNSRAVSWHAWVRQLFVIDKNGGIPEQLPVPRTGFATLSPDGNKIAYNRIFREFRTWKRYRGGQADDIWIYDLKSKQLENITNNPAQDIIPMWHGSKVYFISDRDAVMNLFCYDLATMQLKKISNFDKFDVKYPSLGAEHIAFENGGYIYLMDFATEQVKKISIEIKEDFPQIREKFSNAKDRITEFDISPDGARAVFTARGDVFTVPSEKGNTRNLTKTQGVHERASVWSPDGKWIAYVSDETGETEVWIAKQDGSEKKQLTKNATTYRYNLLWSPDSKKLLCSDKEMKLYFIEIESGKVTQIAKSKVWEILDFSWSPDSKWIAYSMNVSNPMSVINLYSIESGKSTQVTDEFFDSGSPVFSKDGKFLFFISDRNFNATIGNTEWNYSYSNMSRIYGLTLTKNTPSPFAYSSDEVKIESTDAKSDNKSEVKKDDNKTIVVNIELDGIKDRLFDLPIQPGNYAKLKSVGSKLYYVRTGNGIKPSMQVYDFMTKKESEVSDITNYEFSADNKKIIYSKGNDYFITDLSDNIKPGAGKLNLDGMEIVINRQVEWKQIYGESWRQMRDFFYDPNMHGVNWNKVKDKYAELLPFVHSRSDLTYIIGEMIAELNVGHAYTGGGEKEEVPQVPVGYLGAEFKPDKSGFYQITNIFEGRNWEEKTRSPLTEPGLNVKVGDYIIAIDGTNLSDKLSLSQALVNKSEKYVTLKINSNPSENGAREITVKTIASEKDLRYYSWVENNRKYVEKATNGRVAYIHVPDMGVGNGLNEFVKYFYPQVRKDALIVDDRYNGGGNVSPMLIERLRRVLLLAGIARNAEVVTTKPDAVMTGPIVCLINELSASDGDLFPYQFKAAGLGKIIGKRSWGGVIGIRGSLPFIDGGYLNKPEFANFGYDGTWVLEGTGMTPDIEVDNHPAKEWLGEDEQLDRAIKQALDEIKTNTKTKVPTVPPYPDKSK
jgi:tricorn protease